MRDFIDRQKAFPTMTDNCADLKTIILDVCDHPKLVIDKKDAHRVLQRVSQLRYITVNGVSWKVCICFDIRLSAK